MSEQRAIYEPSGLAVVEDAPIAIQDEMRSWQMMRQQADVLVKSGFLQVQSAEQALAIIILGQELGFERMQSFRLIDVIKGKPTLNSHGMATLVQRFCRKYGGYLRPVESTAERATIEFRRAEWPEPQQVTFSSEDAKRAGLWGQTTTWKQYPQNMFYARALANACRMGFPDVVGGIYDPDELGGIPEVPPLPVPTVGGSQRIAGPTVDVTSTVASPEAAPSAIVEVIDGETGEILAVEAPEGEGVTFAEAIANATTQDELAAIGQRMSAEKFNDKPTWAAFNRRKIDLAKENRAAADAAALEAANASGQGSLLDAPRNYENLGQ